MDNTNQNKSSQRSMAIPKKNKVLLRLVKFSEDAANPNGQNLAFIANSMTSFLLDLGFSKESLGLFHSHIATCIHRQDREGMVTIILTIIDNIEASGLPIKEKESQIQIVNKNNQEVNLTIDTVREIFEEHLTTGQIKQLKELLAKKKGGNLKQWFRDLSINTTSDLLSSLLLKLPFLSNL